MSQRRCKWTQTYGSVDSSRRRMDKMCAKSGGWSRERKREGESRIQILWETLAQIVERIKPDAPTGALRVVLASHPGPPAGPSHPRPPPSTRFKQPRTSTVKTQMHNTLPLRADPTQGRDADLSGGDAAYNNKGSHGRVFLGPVTIYSASRIDLS
ncbi:hypothetical protein MSAN_01310100 [Mycena sanguinolenta]|uniref:Uncharacterized protein n=1 Tax=Mycena sanguinolenta TaxID=230812 RepID=A0A8H6YFP9_9AGAR|nr:hypothetical protein MSAN_01310100 [Mycena sanguinolenta]